jgi:hypothetical protein
MTLKNHRTPEQLIADGFSLNPQCKLKSHDNCIIENEFSSDGKIYHKIRQMSKGERMVFDDAEAREKKGEEVFTSFQPFALMAEFHKQKWNIDATKDKYGNIHLKISKYKKRGKRI